MCTTHSKFSCQFFKAIHIFQYDRFYQQLLTIRWNLLPLAKQRAYMLLVNSARNPPNFTIADVMPLNINTYLIVSLVASLYVLDKIHLTTKNCFDSFQQLLNRIYSFLMVLREVLWTSKKIIFENIRISNITVTVFVFGNPILEW